MACYDIKKLIVAKRDMWMDDGGDTSVSVKENTRETETNAKKWNETDSNVRHKNGKQRI